MRRLLTTMTAAAALAIAACGEDEAADTARDTGQQAEQAAQQAAEATGADGLAAETQRLAEEIARAARELAENPEVDADQRLETAEKEANGLAEKAENELQESDPDLARALKDANERLAAGAADLREAQSTEDVGRVLEEELSQALLTRYIVSHEKRGLFDKGATEFTLRSGEEQGTFHLCISP